jgi:catechol 2,3-dioxygenase-like lactoylglutathione lyase family enzyme
MTIEVSAVDHIYVTVADLKRSVAFYDPVMKLLGFRKSTRSIGGEPHVHYFNPATQYTLRPARAAAALHDPYRPGLHHVCFRVPTRDQVDAAAQGLRRLGIEASQPTFYPDYAPDYYAAFFTDPDGIRIEIVALRQLRELIRDHWHELTEFEDPLTKAGLLR